MAVSFKELALSNMLWLANSLWLLASAFLIHLLCIIFPKLSRVSNQKSPISGDEVNQNPDDRNRPQNYKLESKEGQSIDSVDVSSARTSKYEFLGGNSFCGYIEDSQTTSFTVQELFLNPSFEDPKPHQSAADEFDVNSIDAVDDQAEIGRPRADEPSLELDDEVKTGVFVCEEPSLDEDFQQDDKGEIESSQLTFSFNHVSHELTNDFWHTNGKFIADFDGFYGHQSASEEVLAPKTPMCLDTKTLDPYDEDFSGSDSTDSCNDDDDDHHQASVISNTKVEEEEEDEMDNDVLLEHQSYVQKMKKELKHLRNIGLPTILEDSESPRMDSDLKPWKIDQKVGFKDRLDEIQMFYKTYLDKMRRLDILCHQTMYAIGILQLKKPGQLIANRKSSIPSIKSLLAHSLLPNKFRRKGSDPMQKLLRDLELVYVGQLCLSWEILKWQHAKAEELQLFDAMGLRQYGSVAGEFQQFRVIMQRFTEDEPFQGPRVHNYVRSRCANCSLLQVPPIKEDSKNAEDRHAAVSIVRLTDIIEESMHSFWEFIRADKKESGNVVVRDPLDTGLLSDTRTNLAKKERRIKDLVRSGNCIVKKFQKHPDCRLTHELLVALVELKVVARVIGMSGLTSDQLLWCHKKLDMINLVGRKVHIEPSFTLFPC